MSEVNFETRSEPSESDAIRAIVKRLARPHASGGDVIERAAVLAEGTSSTAIIRWIEDHDGLPEEIAAAAATPGLHGARRDGLRTAAQTRRYVLPAGVLT